MLFFSEGGLLEKSNSFSFFHFVDLDEHRLDLAKKMGADLTVRVTSKNGRQVAG